MNENFLLHELFDQQLKLTPNAIALTFEGQSLTYQALNDKSDCLAAYLQSLDVKPETLVALCVDRGFDLVISILAILKAGGAYLPLDIDAPADRLGFILDDAKADIVITQSAYAEKFKHKTVFCIDTEWPLIAANNTIELKRFADDHNERLVYVIYTSGSTGKPKGVQVTHLNVRRLFTATEHWFKFNQHDVWALFHSYAFDMSVWELWGTLLYGGRLVIVPHLVARDPAQFYQLLVQEKVTCLNQTPSAFLPLVRIDQEYAADLLSLRFVTFGGEALNFKALEPWLLRHGDNSPRLINMYGITETTVHSTYRPVTLADVRSGKSQLIGEPIPDLKLYLLNESLQEVDVDEEGEIYIAGAGVTRGYLYRPELSAERFIENSAFSTGKLYKSGDLAKKLASGDIEYIGRSDTQVKVRGFRIELGEIEAVLTEHPSVNETIVMVHEHDGHKALVAYLIADEKASLTQELQALAQAKLSDYMQPTYFVFLAAMPLTVNGKIDRRALPAPDYNLHVVKDPYVAPVNETEQVLTQVWQQLLKVDHIGRHDNFFQLGGDSILVIQVCSLAKKQGLTFGAKQLFLHQTIAELAEHIQQQAPVQSVVTKGVDSILLTPIQHWFFEQNFKQSQHWNQAVLLRLESILPADIIQQALQAVQAHHVNLQTRFVCENGLWQALDNPAFKAVKLTKIDLSDFNDDEKLAILQESSEQAQGDLNLQKGTLMRAMHFKLSAQEYRLLIIIHHLVVDGVSWRILIEDLQTACCQLQAKESIHLPEVGSYKQWTHQLNDYAQTLKTDVYWLNSIQDVKPCLERDFNGENTSASTQTVSLILSQEKTQALLQNPYEKIQDILLASLFLSMGADKTCVIDVEGHGRELVTDTDISRLCAWFTSLFPVVLQCTGSAYDVLQALKETLDKLPENGLDYGVLRYLSNDKAVRQALAERPKADVVFNYLGQFDALFDERSLFSIAQEDYGRVHSAASIRPYVLEVDALVYQGCLKIDFNYSDNLHQRSRIETLVSTVEKNIQSLLDSVAQGDFSLAELKQDDLNVMMQKYPQLEALYPASTTQEGMLFHALGDSAQDVYFEQLCYELAGTLDESIFKKAWTQLIQRYQILRTCLVWKGLEQPLQAVQKEVSLLWEHVDLRDLSRDDAEIRWQTLIQQDRKKVFALDKAPLMRFTLALLPNNSQRLIWTHSHLLLDGWSVANLLKELLYSYAQLLENKSLNLAPVVPYRNYITWLINQENQDAQSFWLQQLQGRDNQLLATETTHQQGFYELCEVLPEAVCQQLQDQAKEHGLTFNSMVQVAWALVLTEKTQLNDVLFGITVSGRSVPVAQIDQMAGLFINTLPLRLKVDTQLSLLAFLKSIQLLQFDMQVYEHSPLSDMQDWLKSPLVFDSIVIFENYPVDPVLSSSDLPLRITAVQAFEHTNYPLTLLAMPQKGLTLQMTYNGALFSEKTIKTILQTVVKHLTLMSTGLEQKLEKLTVSDKDQQANTEFLLASMALDEDF